MRSATVPSGGGRGFVVWRARIIADDQAPSARDSACRHWAAGNFTMGWPESEKDRRKDEGPQHRVTIGKPFAVGKFHVTVDQFAAFVAETGYDAGSKCRTFEDGKVEERSGRSWRNPGFAQSGSHPAVCLSLNDAKAYTDWLARKTGKTYRLLTEAEGEHAARARIEPAACLRYSFGADENDLFRS